MELLICTIRWGEYRNCEAIDEYNWNGENKLHWNLSQNQWTSDNTFSSNMLGSFPNSSFQFMIKDVLSTELYCDLMI